MKLVGATAHYVTEDLDEGPIIEQDAVRVDHRYSVDDLTRLAADVERAVLRGRCCVALRGPHHPIRQPNHRLLTRAGGTSASVGLMMTLASSPMTMTVQPNSSFRGGAAAHLPRLAASEEVPLTGR